MKKILLLLLLINMFFAGYLCKKYTLPCCFGKIVYAEYIYKETEENVYWIDIENLCNNDTTRTYVSEEEYYFYYNIVGDTIQFAYIENEKYPIIPKLKNKK